MLIEILIELMQVLVVALGAPLLVGLVRQLKACLQGRRGASVFQPYADLQKLLGKEAVIPVNTSWIFRFTPYVFATTILLSALIVPVLTTQAAPGFNGNIIVLMYLFLPGAFFLALAGLDTGSAFGRLGSSREMAVAALAEPTAMVAIFAMALRVGSTSLNDIMARSAANSLLLLNPGYGLAFVALFSVALAETGRLPIDNPTPHLDLTLSSRALLLEYSGPYLALIEWAAGMKLFLFLTLLANLFFPWGMALELTPLALIVALMALTLKLGLLALITALLETSVARLRLFHVPALLSGSFTLALLAVLSFLFLK